jgi:hypothetical protein
MCPVRTEKTRHRVALVPTPEAIRGIQSRRWGVVRRNAGPFAGPADLHSSDYASATESELVSRPHSCPRFQR